MPKENSKSVSNNIFFVWFGDELPWTGGLAIHRVNL